MPFAQSYNTQSSQLVCEFYQNFLSFHLGQYTNSLHVQDALATVNICLQMWRTWYICITNYTTNPIECLAAATEHLTSESDLESSVESQRALRPAGGSLFHFRGHMGKFEISNKIAWVLSEQWLSKSVECLASARWDSTGDSKSLSLVSARWLLPSARWD